MRVVKWMIQTAANETEKQISPNSIKQFPLLFRMSSNAHLRRVVRLWKDQEMFSTNSGSLCNIDSRSCIQRNNGLRVRQVSRKAWLRSGQGRVSELKIFTLTSSMNSNDYSESVFLHVSNYTLQLLAISNFNNSSNGSNGKGLIDMPSSNNQCYVIAYRSFQFV